jgi:hypothetical protein
MSLSVDEYTIGLDKASLPLSVTLSNSPSDAVSVTFTPAFDQDENAGTDAAELNDASTITVTPATLDFVAWDTKLSFTVTVSNWDFTKGSTFRLNCGYSGTNAASYDP